MNCTEVEVLGLVDWLRAVLRNLAVHCPVGLRHLAFTVPEILVICFKCLCNILLAIFFQRLDLEIHLLYPVEAIQLPRCPWPKVILRPAV